MSKTAVAIRHVHFEDLGTFEPVLREAGYIVRYYDVGIDDLQTLDPLLPDLLVVLGGPVGVYEADHYPFLVEELRILESRLAAARPTLGICLGAQQVAMALGAKVAPTGIKEIGFSKLTFSNAGREGPLRHLHEVPVLHWHGDAFTIPAGATNLASTPLCATQAFTFGRNILGLQFHPEVDAAGIERWLIGHAAELSAAMVDPRNLRSEAAQVGSELREAASAMLGEWLQKLVP